MKKIRILLSLFMTFVFFISIIVYVPKNEDELKATEYNHNNVVTKTANSHIQKLFSNSTKETVRDDGVTVKNYTPGQPLPEPQSASFSIGDCLQYSAFDDSSPMTSGYFPDRDIKFTAGIKMPVKIYGDWA